MKKLNILTLSLAFSATALLTSCGGEAKVDQAEAPVASETVAPATEIAAPEVAPAEVEAPVEIAPEVVEAPEPVVEPAPVTTPAPEPVVASAPVVEATPEPEPEQAPAGQPTMTFESTEYKFGEINQGDKVNHVFKFKNTGTAPLIISNARASCGCTVPQWPKEPVAPGAEGQIDVVFNSRGKRGQQNKAITITTNIEGQPQQRVYLKGNVLVPPPTPAPEVAPEAPAAE